MGRGGRWGAVALTLAASLVLGGCGGDEDPISAASTCEELADAVVARLQIVLDDFAELEERSGALPTAAPSSVATLPEVGERLDRRANELGCTTEEGRRLVAERLDQLSADSPAAELLLQLMLSGPTKTPGPAPR